MARLYDLEQSYFLGWTPQQLHPLLSLGVQVITHRATKIIEVKDEHTKIVRHDSLKLASALKVALNS